MGPPAAAGAAAGGGGGASLGFGIFAAVSGAYAQYQQQQQAKAYARFNEQQAKNAAEDALRVADAETERMHIRNALLRGRRRAAMAASGTVVDSGSNQFIQEDDEIMMGIDINAVRVNAQRAAHGFSAQALAFGSEASGFSGFPAVANLIGGVGSAVARYRLGSPLTAAPNSEPAIPTYRPSPLATGRTPSLSSGPPRID